MKKTANIGTYNKLTSLEGLRGFFGSFEFAQVQETQKLISQTEVSSIEDTEKYIAEKSTDFIREKLMDQAQCLKIIQGNQIRTYPKLQTNRTSIRGKSVPFISDLYSAKSTITKEELESYLNSYVRGQHHIKNEQKLLLLVMILENGDEELLKKYCREKNTLGLLLIYPDFVNYNPARENIFKRWFKQIDALHNEEYAFDKNSLWGKYLRENFGEVKTVQSRLSKFNEATQANIQGTKSRVEESLDKQKVGIEVFKKYVTGKHLQEVGLLIEQTKAMNSLSKAEILDYFSEEEYFKKLQIDLMHLILNGKDPGNIGKITDMFTLLRYFKGIDKIDKHNVKEKIKEYLVITLSRDTDIAEIIFMSLIFASKGISFTEMNIKGEIRDISLFFPLFYPEFIKNYEESSLFFSWWFTQIRGKLKIDTENPNSNLWKYLLQNFSEVDTVKQKYSKISYSGLEEGIDIPDDNDLEILFNSLGIPQDKEARKKYDGFLRRIGKVHSLDGDGESEIEAFIAKGIIRGDYVGLNGSPVEVSKAIEERNFIKIFHHLGLPTIPANSRKKIKKFLLEDNREISREYVPVTCMCAVRLMNHDIQRDPKIVEYVRDRALFILAFPPFLKSFSEKEQNQFFEVYISSLINYDEIKNIDSHLWEYLLKYFGDNEIITGTYKRIKDGREDVFSGLSERFESVWSEKVQLNGLTYAQRIARYESAEDLPDTKLILDSAGRLTLHGVTTAGHKKSIHIIIYKRSNSNKLSEPKIFVIPQGESVEGNVSGEYLNGKYSYKVFAHRNALPFRGQRELPEEIVSLEARNLTIPMKGEARGEKKRTGAPETKPRKAQEENYDAYLPEDTRIDGECIILEYPEGKEIIYKVGEDGKCSLISMYGEQNPEIAVGLNRFLLEIIEADISGILKLRAEAKRKEEEEERKRAEETRQAEEKAEKEENERVKKEAILKAREDLLKNGGFGTILDSGLAFLAEASKQSRSNSEGIAYWKIYPSDGIVTRISKLCEQLGFVVSLDYDQDENLEFISLNSREFGHADYSCEVVPVTYREGNINPYGREIADALVERIVGTLFKYNFNQDKKNKKASEEISKKATERAKLITQTQKRLKAGVALAAEIPIEIEDSDDKEVVNWDTRNDIGYVSMQGENNTTSIHEVETMNLGIQGRVGLLRAGGEGNNISEQKSADNINMVIDHIRNDESEFMIDYFFRRVYKTVKLSFKATKKPKILGDKDVYTTFTGEAKKVVDKMRIGLSEDINQEEMKSICLEVLEEFKKNRVELAVVMPKVFKATDLVFSE